MWNPSAAGIGKQAEAAPCNIIMINTHGSAVEKYEKFRIIMQMLDDSNIDVDDDRFSDRFTKWKVRS